MWAIIPILRVLALAELVASIADESARRGTDDTKGLACLRRAVNGLQRRRWRAGHATSMTWTSGQQWRCASDDDQAGQSFSVSPNFRQDW